MWAIVVVIVAILAVAVPVGVPWFFNWLSPRTDARRRSRDDNYFFAACESGWMTRYRWFNRRLPANPRCRLCLVPFGGVGRLLRIRPSRKNPLVPWKKMSRTENRRVLALDKVGSYYAGS
jgi:hypothetical protein